MSKKIWIEKILRIFLVFILAVSVAICGWDRSLALQLSPPLRSVEGPAKTMGAWYTPPMPENINERMAGLHAALLPNGKVLIVNGGDARSYLSCPSFVCGSKTKGKDTRKSWLFDNTSLFDPSLSDPDPILDDKGNPISSVNYSYGQNPIKGILKLFRQEISRIDYQANPYTKIKSPPSPVKYKGSNEDQVNDPFCGGNIHLPNGDVLFISGSWFPYPAPTPLGTKQANRYNWRENKWELAGEMADGHWYPGLLPLDSGKIAVFSGISYNELKVSTKLEIYDPNKSAKEAWKSIDIGSIPNSPYKTLKEDNQPDFIDLYPHTYPTKDGRFLITGDSGGTRELPPRKTHKTYFMSIEDSKKGLSVKFDPGPERKGWSKYYTTSIPDPSSPGDILLMGGLEGLNDPTLGPDTPVAGTRTTAQLERWYSPTCQTTEANCSEKLGKWELDDSFLGAGPYGRRVTLNAVILPTKQILVVGGGNYVFHLPVHHPLLMTPDASANQGYKTQWMNPGTEPRLYHNNALLLPDGRVLILGGQGAYAAWDDRKGSIPQSVNISQQLRLDIKPGGVELAEKGQNFLSAETWQPEIFNPPYLFIDGPRPEIDQAPPKIGYGGQESIKVKNPTKQASLVLIRLGSATHGLNFDQRLVDLDFQQNITNDVNNLKETTVSFTAPTDKHLNPPGYYMLFYVNEKGKPSHAKILELTL